MYLFYREFLPGTLGIHGAVIAASLRYGATRQNTFARPHERRVRVTAEGIFCDDRFIPRATIKQGRYQPRPPIAEGAKKRLAGSTVQLFDRWGRMVFEGEVATEAEGVALLRALGLDASQQRAEFRVVSPLLQSQARIVMAFGGLTALLTFALHAITPAASRLLPSLLLPAFALSAIPAKLVVGRDGLLYHWMGWRRFIAMADIVNASPEGDSSIKLEMTGGKQEIIYLHSPKQRGGVFTQYRDAVLARIREAHASQRALGPTVDLTTLIAQGERTTEEWKTALAALHEADPGYRKAAVREEDLWRVVEDPRADPDARAGAAVLLRKGLDAEGKARVRVAAAATASPKLRVALEAALEESDEAALEALDQVAVKRAR